MTKTEALKWSRLARRQYMMSHAIKPDGCRAEIPCPLDAQRNPHRPAHRVTVWHKPWQKVGAAMINAAFVEHFCSEFPDERCEAMS